MHQFPGQTDLGLNHGHYVYYKIGSELKVYESWCFHMYSEGDSTSHLELVWWLDGLLHIAQHITSAQ